MQHNILNQLSDRLARDYDAATWKAAFTTAPAFREAEFSVACVDLHGPELSRDTLDLLAGRFGGRCEPCAQGKWLLVFERQDEAIRAALVIQQLARREGARICLASGRAREAHLDCAGTPLDVLVGTLVDDVLHGLFRTPSWTVSVLPRCYESMADALQACCANGLVAAEWNDGRVSWATISVPPAAQSTFAGLGSASFA